MCHEVKGNGYDLFLEISPNGFVGTKTLTWWGDRAWGSLYLQRPSYSIDETGQFVDRPSLQEAIAELPTISVVGKVDHSQIHLDIIGGMHVSPIIHSERWARPSLDFRYGRLVLCDVPVVFGGYDIVFFDGHTASVKAFRFPFKREAEKIARWCFPGFEICSIPLNREWQEGDSAKGIVYEEGESYHILKA